jgi:hypothetical protein
MVVLGKIKVWMGDVAGKPRHAAGLPIDDSWTGR